MKYKVVQEKEMFFYPTQKKYREGNSFPVNFKLKSFVTDLEISKENFEKLELVPNVITIVRLCTYYNHLMQVAT